MPFNHTGALLTLHANSWLDLLGGVTRGVNTSLDDNNDSVGFLAGFGLNLNGGKFLVNAATHIGPETPNDNHDLRYLSDIYATWKITDKWTSITEFDFARDDGADADGYGVAQYLTYAINDMFTVKIRGEIWRDDKGFYVASFADPHDPMRGLGGQAVIDPRTVGGGPDDLRRAHIWGRYQAARAETAERPNDSSGNPRRSFIQRHTAIQRFEGRHHGHRGDGRDHHFLASDFVTLDG